MAFYSNKNHSPIVQFILWTAKLKVFIAACSVKQQKKDNNLLGVGLEILQMQEKEME